MVVSISFYPTKERKDAKFKTMYPKCEKSIISNCVKLNYLNFLRHTCYIFIECNGKFILKKDV